MIMDENAAEAGEESNRREGLASALGMDGKKGEQGRAQDMQPMQFAADAYPGLVGMGNRLLDQGLTNRRHRGG